MLIDMKKVYYPKKENLLFENPISPGDELNFGLNPMVEIDGYHYDKEMFYLIDFFGIKRNMYYVSSYGRVISMNTRKVIVPTMRQGYPTAYLRLENPDDNTAGASSFSIHRLVAMAFVPKRIPEDILENKDIINHKNTIKYCNYYKNLEWCTYQYNTMHARLNNVYDRKQIMFYNNTNEQEPRKVLGEDIGVSRLTDAQVHIICQNLVLGKSNGECCIAAGLEDDKKNRTIVCNIAAGRRWQHISSQYNINKMTKDVVDKTMYVEDVCRLLQEGKTIKEITQILPLDDNYDRARMFVSGIKNRKSYTDISSRYNF